jgi:uncharacterized protein YjeT (DUF2065 family)
MGPVSAPRHFVLRRARDDGWTPLARQKETRMDASIFLARMLGLFFLVMGVGIVVGMQGYREMAEEFLKSRALIYVAGLLAFLPGLAIVLTHNLWVGDWRVIITIFGWLGLIGGAFRLLFPMQVRIIGSAMLQNGQALRIGGLAVVVLGAVLTWFGFSA